MKEIRLVKEGDSIILDQGFQYGMMLFETIYITPKGHPVFLQEHLNRLSQASTQLGLIYEDLSDLVIKLVRQQELKDVALKLMLSDQNVLGMVRPQPYKEEHYNKGFKICFSRSAKGVGQPLSHLKSANFSQHIIEKRLATQRGFNECILITPEEDVLEGTVSNVFGIKEGKIYTPAQDMGILNGILRQWVMEHYEVVETRISAESLQYDMDEVFLTNSLMGIMPVNMVEEQAKSMECSKEIWEAYRRKVLEP